MDNNYYHYHYVVCYKEIMESYVAILTVANSPQHEYNSHDIVLLWCLDQCMIFFVDRQFN